VLRRAPLLPSDLAFTGFRGVQRLNPIAGLLGMNKLEQTELAEAQERFRGIFESSKDAIGYATLEGKLVDVNEGYTRLLKVAPEKKCWRCDTRITHPVNTQAPNRAVVQRMLETGEPSTSESEFLREDGSRVPIELTAFLVRGTDVTPIGLAAIVKDITERKRIEAALSRSSEQVRLLLRFLKLSEWQSNGETSTQSGDTADADATFPSQNLVKSSLRQ
jgi:PAS domain S-box-containing protein